MLTDAQVQRFRDRGFLVFERLIEGQRLTSCLSVFDELVGRGRTLTAPEPHWSLELDGEGQPQPGLLHKVQGVCFVEPRVLELAREPGIVDRVAALLSNEEVDVFGTKFHADARIVEHRQEPGMHGSWTDVDEDAAVRFNVRAAVPS